MHGYDSYSNVTEKDESDFYSWHWIAMPNGVDSPPSGWMRRTFTSYQYQNSKSAWVTAHIVNKPSQVLVTDGSGHPVLSRSVFFMTRRR